MNQDKYVLEVNSDATLYFFNSISADRTITKVVQFSLKELDSNHSPEFSNVYNLGFGDYDSTTDTVDDTVRSQNGDRDEVLATVSAAALNFINKYPTCIIYAVGSTPDRTRLYQMGLNRFYDEIIVEHELYGLKDDGWRVFERNTNYLAFVMRKR